MVFSDILFILEAGFEGALVLLVGVIAYKIYKMKISTQSKCCGDAVEINTENDGVHREENNV
jgi:hypothetical protein